MHWPFTCVSRPSQALAVTLIREARPGVCFTVTRLHEPMGSIEEHPERHSTQVRPLVPSRLQPRYLPTGSDPAFDCDHSDL